MSLLEILVLILVLGVAWYILPPVIALIVTVIVFLGYLGYLRG